MRTVIKPSGAEMRPEMPRVKVKLWKIVSDIGISKAMLNK